MSRPEAFPDDLEPVTNGADGTEGTEVVAGVAPLDELTKAEAVRAVERVKAEHGRNLPIEEPAYRFKDGEKPQRYAPAIGHKQPQRPLDPLRPFRAPQTPRKHRSDVPVLVLALAIAGIVMIVVCVGGFALYSGIGNPFGAVTRPGH